MCVHTNLPIPHTKQDCEKYIRELGGSTLEFQDNYLAWENPGIGRYLVFLAIEGIVFFALVLLIEYRVFHAITRIFKPVNPIVGFVSEESSLADDDDVLAEKTRVMVPERINDVLVIKELSKVFAGNGRKFLFHLAVPNIA